jgi:hypothetical protein
MIFLSLGSLGDRHSRHVKSFGTTDAAKVLYAGDPNQPNIRGLVGGNSLHKGTPHTWLLKGPGGVNQGQCFHWRTNSLRNATNYMILFDGLSW